MKPYFVTATGTEVGKTVISAALISGCQANGFSATYWKPVQCGTEAEDRNFILDHCPGAIVTKNGYTYHTPASPDQAAIRECCEDVSIQKLLHLVPQSKTPLVIEGAGGLLVPLNSHSETWIDLLQNLDCHILLVAPSGLGTLNQTSLNLHCLNTHGLTPHAVILSGDKHEDNLLSLKRMHPSLSQRFISFENVPKFSSHDKWQERTKELWSALSTIGDEHDLSQGNGKKKNHIWHPFTQHAKADAPVHFTKARGPWLLDHKNRPLFDATGSWWSNSVGHGRKEIGAAIAHQQQKLDHVLLAGASHRPAAELARKIIEKSKGTLNHAFYTDNGSCSVEAAIKMAVQSFYNKGKRRTKLLAIRGGYHGDTYGAMSVAATSGFYAPFVPQLFKNLWLNPVTEHPSMHCPTGPAALAKAIEEMKSLFEENHSEIAAVIVEPLIQGAAGMVVQHLPWLQKLTQIAQSYDVPVIYDEVFTGMGRTGSFFAFQRAGTRPDIVCISKGLTGGNLPLAMTLTSERIYDTFLSESMGHAFLHGHTYTGNPIACAAALATLDLYEKHQLLQNAKMIEKRFHQWIECHRHNLGLKNPRVMGAVLAFELPGSQGEGSNYFDLEKEQIAKLALKNGLFLRPLGNTVYLTPAIATNTLEIDWLLEQLLRTLRDYQSSSSSTGDKKSSSSSTSSVSSSKFFTGIWPTPKPIGPSVSSESSSDCTNS